jgi:hypothetical protein
MAADTGCTLSLADPTTPLLNETPTPIGVKITAANGDTMHGTSKGNLPIALPSTATECHRVPGLHTPLLSIGQPCDAGCITIFSATKVAIVKAHNVEIKLKGPPVAIGTRIPPGLWYIPVPAIAKPNQIPTMPEPQRQITAHSAYHQRNSQKLATFLHAAAGYPPISTLCKAIDAGFLATWPGLSSPLIRKHLEISVPTIMGRLKCTRQGIRSTHPINAPPKLDSEEADTLEPPRSHMDRAHEVGTSVFQLDDLKGLICNDLPGRFPFVSSRGHNYIFILYDYDSNAILAEPIKSRQTEHLIQGYEACYKRLKRAGITPILQRLDNEISKELIHCIERKQLKYQLAHAYDHRNNLAERAIQTFKAHFISVLNGTDERFPPHLWCRLIPQTVLTLNMLQPSRINPKLSAYNQVFGNFDFNATPLAPMGTKVIVYERKKQRLSTWSDHGQHGWYTGSAPHHYRNYSVFITATRAIRICDTVVFLPTKFPMPATSSTDRITEALENLVTELRNPRPAAPFLTEGSPTQHAIDTLETFFQNRLLTTTSRPIAPPPPRVTPTDPPPRVTPTDPPPRVPPERPAPRVSATAKAKQKAIYRDPRIQDSHIICPDIATRVTRSRLQNTLFSNGLSKATAFLTLEASAVETTIHHGLAVTHYKTGKQMEYKDLIRDPHYQDDWMISSANELGRLAQGVGDRVKGTNTIFFITKDKVPDGRTVTYARVVCTVRPEKDEMNRTRITAGGNLITDYPGDVSTETAGLETVKIHWNSVLSTPGAKWMGMDISNMYLNTPLDRYEYMRMHLRDIPQEIIDQYNLTDIAEPNGFVYIEIRRAMYGLKQAGFLANRELKKVLAAAGYHPAKHTPGLFLHESRPISFTLVVDDFGVKYTNKEDALHLEKTISDHYPMKSDWKGERYIGIDLDWNYEERTLKTSMKGYIKRALLQFQHPTPAKPVNSPSRYSPPQYGAKQQMTKLDISDPISQSQRTHLQQVTGKFLYPARAVDDTMMHALNNLATRVHDGTQDTMNEIIHFLNYCATHLEPSTIYRASEMILCIDSDASYLVAAMARSRAGGFFYLGNKDQKLFNGSISVIAKIIKNVMSSAAEAEIAALFLNAKHSIPMRNTLIELGHAQPPTPIRTDNSTANGIMNSTVKQNRSKAIDMRFYWLRDRVDQGQFNVFWAPGAVNLADYFTKHHSPAHHARLRPIYLSTLTSPTDMQGCIEILKTPPARPARAQDMIASHSNLSVVTSQTSVIPSHPLSALSAALAQTTRRISGITSLLARITHTHNY